MIRRSLVLSVVSAFCMSFSCAAVLADVPLRSSATAYHILARTTLALKDYKLRSQGCNVGVNNRGGLLNAAGPKFASNTQLVADIVQGLGRGGEIFQIFSNEGPLGGIVVSDPSGPASARFPGHGFTPPVITAETDAAFIVACNRLPGGNFPAAFSSGNVDVIAKKGGSDCVFKCRRLPCAQVADSDPGNGICDLPPGTYGKVNAKNNAKISFDGGMYNIKSYQNGKGVLMMTKAPATLNIGEAKDLVLGDAAVLALECGELRINYLGGKSTQRDVVFGKHSRVTMDLCAPYAQLRLGRSNTLTGHLFAGAVSTDVNNSGFCCAGCACFDNFWPLKAGEGDVIKLSGGCDLRNVSRVVICDADASIVSRSVDEISARVPNVGAPKSCQVKIETLSGDFIASETLAVEED